MKIKSKRFIAPTWSVLGRVGLGGRSHRRSGSLSLSHQDREVLRQSCGLLLRESAKILDCPLRYAALHLSFVPPRTLLEYGILERGQRASMAEAVSSFTPESGAANYLVSNVPCSMIFAMRS